MNKLPQTPNWGLLPEQVKHIIRQREWDNTATLKARLSGRKVFPISLGLKPPSGRTAISDMQHFQKYIKLWQTFSIQKFIRWETRNYRDLSEQKIPTFLTLDSVEDLIEFIGVEARKRSVIWSKNMSPLLEINKDLYPALVKHLDVIEKITHQDAQLLAQLIPQLSAGMGEGLYLRALPLVGVDTKFLETYKTLIADLLDILHDDNVSKAGGLLEWLGCLTAPKGWLTIRPLCQKTIASMAGLPIMQLTGDMLRQYTLPAPNILVVENLQTGLGLPEMEDTIAVIGGGKNITWMDAKWLKNKRVAYWGDIDTWGLSILSDVRSRLGHVEPLMMDTNTLVLHEERMVNERRPVENSPEYLTEAETQLFEHLKSYVFKDSRLEQERLSTDYIHLKLKKWLSA